jgi:FtsH-binding integral membrane protein
VALSAARRAWWLTLALLAAGLASWLAAALLVRAELFWLGVGVMALAIPVYLLGARFIRVRRLDGERIWIAGASVNFLARLPDLPR